LPHRDIDPAPFSSTRRAWLSWSSAIAHAREFESPSAMTTPSRSTRQAGFLSRIKVVTAATSCISLVEDEQAACEIVKKLTRINARMKYCRSIK